MTETAETHLKLMNAYRQLDPSVIFFISRTYDAKLFTYKANRVGNRLVDRNEVSCVSVMVPEFKKESEINPLLLKEFFGINVAPLAGTTKYTACVNGFKERIFTLNLKKNSTPEKSDGKVIATTDFHLPDGSVLKGVELVNVHMDVTFNRLDIPDVSKVEIFGCIQKALVPTLYHKSFITLPITPGNPEMLLVSENIIITEDMKRRFNPISLTKQWLTGGGGAKGESTIVDVPATSNETTTKPVDRKEVLCKDSVTNKKFQ